MLVLMMVALKYPNVGLRKTPSKSDLSSDNSPGILLETEGHRVKHNSIDCATSHNNKS